MASFRSAIGDSHTFCVLPLGQRCFTKPSNSWSVEPAYNTYFYDIFNEPENPVSHIAISLDSEMSFRPGRGAIVSAIILAEDESPRSYFLGYLKNEKPTCFVEIKRDVEASEAISLYIVEKSISSVDHDLENMKEQDKTGSNWKRGCFQELGI